MRMILTALAHNGLGDRLCDLFGLVACGRLLGLNVKTYWANEARNFAWGQALYDMTLFDFSELCEVVGGGNDSGCNIINHNPSCTLSPVKLKIWLEEKGQDQIGYDHIEYLYYKAASCLKPSKELRSCLCDTSDYIAIHLRRTDKIHCQGGDRRHETCIDEYSVIMKRLLAYVDELVKDGHNKFYILSDDAEYKLEFCELLSKRCDKIQTLVMNEDALLCAHPYKEGLYAVYEWFCMTRCKMILQGIKYSTYSMSAAMVNNIPLVNFCGYEPEHLMHAWAPCLMKLIMPYAVRNNFTYEESKEFLKNHWIPLRLL